MTRRGQATRERLLDATRRTVREVGYAHATTRAIAREAGVTEATIYRHFPDKRALFFAAALQNSSAMLGELADLPSRAGTGTVEANLAWALAHLATLRDEVLPLELALLTDPQMTRPTTSVPDGSPGAAGVMPGPPSIISSYLAAERSLGRVRADVDPDHATVVLLSLLFGMSLQPASDGARDGAVTAAVRLVVHGLGTREASRDSAG